MSYYDYTLYLRNDDTMFFFEVHKFHSHHESWIMWLYTIYTTNRLTRFQQQYLVNAWGVDHIGSRPWLGTLEYTHTHTHTPWRGSRVGYTPGNFHVLNLKIPPLEKEKHRLRPNTHQFLGSIFIFFGVIFVDIGFEGKNKPFFNP